MTATEQFRDAIARAGLTPPDTIEADGELHRFASNGKRDDDAGWYVFHANGIAAGAFGCWRAGVSETWHANIGRKLSAVETLERSRRIADAEAKRDAAQVKRHAEAAERAAQLWQAAQSANPAHPYLAAKGIEPHGIRQDGDTLLVPMRNAAGALRNLQRIAPDGTKHFLYGGEVSGCYFGIGKPAGTPQVCEGFATGASVRECTGDAVAVAFTCGNLEPVARALRTKYPKATLVIAADDDYRTDRNPGMTKATAAARSVGGLLAVPDFGDNRPEGATDFNDMHRLCGAEAVKRAIANARAPVAPDDQATTANAVAADPWPEPQPLHAEGELAPYPLDALPAGIGEAVREVVAYVQCPPALAACCALSALSLAAQHLADVARDDALRGPVSLYLLAVAESGERKSTCDGYFLEGLREWEKTEHERMKPEIAKRCADFGAWEQRRDGIKARIKDAARKGDSTQASRDELAEVEADKPELLRVPGLLYGDATPEALAWNLATGWPSAGVISSEAGIVLGSHGMKDESLMRNLALLNALWDGGSHRVDRRTRDCFTLTGARLTMGLAAQPETVRQFMEGTKGLVRGTGFAARFLLTAPDSTQGTRLYRPSTGGAATAAFGARLRTLLQTAANVDAHGALQPPLLTLAPAAFNIWRAFHDDTERELRPGGDMSQVRDVASKAADNVARLAALFHLFANGPGGRIDADAVTAAARVVTWHLFAARAFLDDVAAPREAVNARRLDAWLVDRCRMTGKAEVSRRDVQIYGPGAIRKRHDLDAALDVLIDAQRARVIEASIAVNPALLGATP